MIKSVSGNGIYLNIKICKCLFSNLSGSVAQLQVDENGNK